MPLIWIWFKVPTNTVCLFQKAIWLVLTYNCLDQVPFCSSAPSRPHQVQEGRTENHPCCCYSMPAKVPQRCSQLSFPAWNYAPQLLGKVTPTFSPIVNAARKWKSTTKYHPKCAKHHENASHPSGFNLWTIINKMTCFKCFNIKTPCKRMIHVCLGKLSFLLQNASNPNVQNITSTSKKCHLFVQNTMWMHDSCMFWYVLETNLWLRGPDLHLNSIFPKQGPNEARK